MAVTRGPKIVTDGLIFCVDAATQRSYSGGSEWVDLVDDNDSTLINGPTLDAEYGGGMTFDGTDDYGTFPSPFASGAAQTCEVWTNAVSSTGADDNYSYLLHNNSLSNTIGASYMTMGIRNNGKYFGAFDGEHIAMETTVTASKSNIIQLVLTWDGITQKAYVGAQLESSNPLSGPVQNFSTTTSVGDFRNGNFRMIDGRIYSIRIYNRALSDSEIRQNYNATKGRFGL